MDKILFENFVVYTFLLFRREINFLVKAEEVDNFLSNARKIIDKNMDFFSSSRPSNDKASIFAEKLCKICVRHENDSPNYMPYGYFRVSSDKFGSGEYFTIDGFHSMLSMNSTTIISSHGDCMISIDDLGKKAIKKYLINLDGKIYFESHFIFSAEKEFYEKTVINGKTFVSLEQSKEAIENLRIIQFRPIVFKSPNQSFVGRGPLVKYEEGVFENLLNDLGL